MVFVLVGILFAVIIAMSGDSYLKLLTKENKILYTIINGTLSSGKLFWQKFFVMLCPIILVAIIGLSFYSSLLTFVMICYQSALLTLSIFAIVSTYGLSGVLNVLFVILPINLLYILTLIFFSSICVKRCFVAKRFNKFLYGFKNEDYVFGLITAFLGIILICVLGTLIVPLFLKNAIFIIF